MDKRVYELKIDPELKDLIPPLSEEEHRLLEDSIVRDGCDTPLTVWNGTIVDGHNRYEICIRHNIPFTYEERDFADKDAAMFWMLEHQLARRNLNGYQRSELALKFEPMLRQQARNRMATSTGGHQARPLQNSAEAEKGNSMDKLGRMAGVSRDTLAKVKKIDSEADDETKQKLRSGEISIHKAFTDLVNQEHEGETRICECCGEEKPFSEFRIPSKSQENRPICKACETKARQAAKEAEIAASLPVPTEKSGMGVRDGQLAHVGAQFPDDPALFDQVIHLLETAQCAFLASFQTTIARYRPSMICEENNDLIRDMIDAVADEAETILNTHLTNSMKEEMKNEP